MEPYLVIARETVQQGYYFVASCGVDDFIDSGEGKVILGTTLVQVSEICAHSPFFVLFVDHHYVC
jgi:hypothetical protein